MNNLIKLKHKILDIQITISGIITLIIEKKDLIFIPGDCMAIYTKKGDSRPYSIASGVNDEFLVFLIRHIPSGEVSSQIKKMKKGEGIYLSKPFGWFRPGNNQNNSKNIFFATGTGIAPFLSYVKTYPKNPPLKLFYGTRLNNDLIGIKYFDKTNKYIAISQEKTNYHKGRITDFLKDIPISENINYYCCGNEKMINEIRGFLTNKGILNINIYNEVFFHE